MTDKQKNIFDMSGKELVGLATSLAICLSEKYDKDSLFTLKLLFQSVASAISTIELQNFDRNKKLK